MMAYRIPELDSFVITNVKFTGVTLGDGAYGKVEEVTISGTVCAAKRLHGELVHYALPQQERQLRERFADECKILSQLRHPRIVQFLGIYYEPKSRLPLLIMERLLTDLHGVLENTPNIPLNLKFSFLQDVAQGLSYLHNRTPKPIAHRDLTARNVLLNSAMVAKIADLGVSRIVNIKPGKALATMTRAPGNANYMPPEAVEQDSKYTTSIDIFSYGNLALFILTQKFPEPKAATYVNERNQKVVARTEIERRGDEVQMLHNNLGRRHSLVQLVEECLQNNPKQRPKVPDILNALSQVQVALDARTKLQLTKELLEKEQRVVDLESQLQRKTTEVENQQELIGQQRKQVDDLSEENKRLKQKVQTLEEQVKGLEENVAIKEQLISDKILVVDGHKRALDAMQKQVTALQGGSETGSSLDSILLEERMQQLMESQKKDVECLAKSYNEDVLTLRELVKYKDRQLRSQQMKLTHMMQECHDKMLHLYRNLQDANSKLIKSESTKLKNAISFKELDAFVKHLEVEMQQKTTESEDPQLPVDTHKLVVDRVLRRNISLLYQNLDPTGDLTVLRPYVADKDMIWVDMHQQRQAKVLVLYGFLLKSNATKPLDLQSICSALSGQEFVEPELMLDYQHATLLAKRCSPQQSSISSLSNVFLALLRDIIAELKRQPQTLLQIKEILSSLVIPLDVDRMVAKLIKPLVYDHAQTLDQLFECLSPYLNPLSVELLEVIMQLLGFKTTLNMVNEYISTRALRFGHLVLCQRSPESNTHTPSTFESIHTASIEDLQSTYPQIFARLPRYKLETLQCVVRVSVEVDKSVLCLLDYNNILTAVCTFLVVPKAALVHIGCSKSPLVLVWAISQDAFDFVKNYAGVYETSLIEQRIVKLAIGGFTYSVSSQKESELMQASYHGLASKVQDCLKTRVNVNKIFFTGLTALMIATQNGHDHIVELLLEAGAAVNYEDQTRNETALMVATLTGFSKLSKAIEILLAAGAKIHHKNKFGVTALSMASFSGHEKAVEILLAAGAKVDDPNKAGLTPLLMASHNGHINIVKTLLLAGAKINHRSKNDSTALMWASRKGHSKVVEALIEAGARSDMRDKDNKTALDWAKENNHSEVINVLSSTKLTR